jgi:hypothetical protein
MTPLRRRLVFGALASIAAPALLAGAQPGPRPRVAIVFNGTAETHGVLLEAFLRGMNELGYTNGQSVSLDVRWANSQFHRLPEIISGLLDRKPDVLVARDRRRFGQRKMRAARCRS